MRCSATCIECDDSQKNTEVIWLRGFLLCDTAELRPEDIHCVTGFVLDLQAAAAAAAAAAPLLKSPLTTAQHAAAAAAAANYGAAARAAAAAVSAAPAPTLAPLAAT